MSWRRISLALVLCLGWAATAQAQITFVSASTVSFTTAANHIFTAPAGIQDDDLIVVVQMFEDDPANETVSNTHGFTSRIDCSNTGGGPDQRMVVWTKRAASESGNYTFTHPSLWRGGVMAVFRGVDTAGTGLDAIGTCGTGFGTGPAAPAVSTTVADTMIVGLFVIEDGAGVVPPTGMTEGASSDAGQAEISYVLQAGTGTTGIKTATSGSGNYTAALLALTPVGGAPPASAPSGLLLMGCCAW